MFWYILLGILAIIVIVGILLWIFGNRIWSGTMALSGMVISICFGLLMMIVVFAIPMQKKQYKEEINSFKKQKEYIEQIAPTLPTTDNYALTIKRIEQNEWLYDVQYKYENYKFWYLIPDEIMELTPIE